MTLTSPGRFIALLAVLVALFAGAFALGHASSSNTTGSVSEPTPTHVAPATITTIVMPASAASLPALRRPKRTAASPASTPSAAPSAPAATPSSPAPAPSAPKSGSGGGSSGGSIVGG